MALVDEYVFICEDLPKKSFSFFRNRRTEFCDITFKVEDRSIKAHRIILAAAIPYFYQLFSDQETPHSEKKEIAFSDVDFDVLKALIEYAYNYKLKISMENVKMLLSGACILQMDEVKNECCRFLADRLNSENALDIRCFSLSLGCSELVEEIDGFIKRNFIKVITTEKFLNISFSELNNFISSDELNVKNEENVFECAMTWVKKCPEERRENLPELLKNVRFPFLELRYIKNYVAKEELIRSSLLCMKILQEAILYNCLPEERNETYCFCISPRRNVTDDPKRGTEEDLSICILSEDFEVQCFDSVKEKWETKMIDGIPSNCSPSESVVALSKKMYCFNPDVTHVIDLETNSYSSCTGMRHPRTNPGSVTCKNKIFVCGGVKNLSLSNIVECFDPKTEEWTELTPMNISRSDMGVAAYKEFIYILGGFTRKRPVISNCVEKYNVETGMIVGSSPMIAGRQSFGCCTLNDKIYVCGGCDGALIGFRTAEVFDPVTDQWKFIASMNEPRCRCKSVSYCNKIYSIGGPTYNDESFAVEIYDPETEEWKCGKPTNKMQDIVGAAIISLPSV